MGLIDAHHHVWDLTVREQDWLASDEALAPLRRNFGVEDLEPLARDAGVTATVVVQTVCEPGETPELLALAARGGLIAAVVGWVDLTAEGVADRLAELRSLPGGRALASVRHQVQSEPDPQWLLRPDVLRGRARVAEAGLVYDLVVTPGQLPAATRAAQLVPELVFVLDHLGKPPIGEGELEPWATAVRDLAAQPNAVCKLSGMVTEAAPDRAGPSELRPFAEVVIEAFGPQRLMFGSDWPVSTLAADYARVVSIARELTAGLSESEQAAVFSGTADRVYRISERA